MTEKTKKLYHSLLMFLSLALLAGLGFYVQKNSTSFTQLKAVKIEYVVLLILAHALTFIFLGQTHNLPLIKNKIILKFREWFGLCLVAELFNLLLPANGGTGIRMLYLKNNKKLAIRDFLTLSFASVLIGFTLLGIMGIFYCELFLQKNNSIYTLLESIFVALTISGIILILAADTISKIFKFKRRYSPKTYLKDIKLTSQLAFYWLAVFAIYPIKVYLSFKTIGIDLTFFQSIELSLMLITSFIFQVLPGNIGVKELITTYVARQFGIPMEAALIASLIDRVILLFFLFPVGFYFYWQLFLESAIPKIFWPRPKQSAQTSP